MGRSEKGLYLGGVCLVTDRCACTLTYLEMAREVLDAGIKCIQLRDKSCTRREIFRHALALREITRDFDAYLIINDYADIAAAVDADGVHLGQEDLPLEEARKVLGGEKIIGISTHSVDEARQAEEEGADYVGFGPVFQTTTKKTGPARGVGSLREINDTVGIPVMAIGGLDHKNCCSAYDCGASAVAAASSILSGDVRRNADFFLQSASRFA